MITDGAETLSISYVGKSDGDSFWAGVEDPALLDENFSISLSIGDETARLNYAGAISG
jgi:hypothetical protein